MAGAKHSKAEQGKASQGRGSRNPAASNNCRYGRIVGRGGRSGGATLSGEAEGEVGAVRIWLLITWRGPRAPGAGGTRCWNWAGGLGFPPFDGPIAGPVS